MATSLLIFQSQLFKQMAGDRNIQNRIDKEYIHSIFWATSAKDTETKDNSQTNHLKVTMFILNIFPTLHFLSK